MTPKAFTFVRVVVLGAAAVHAGSPALQRRPVALVSQTPSVSPAAKKALAIRGGGGLDLDQVVIAQAFTALNGVNAVFTTLFPKKALTSYGLSPLSPPAEWIFRGSNAISASITLTLFCLFFKKTNVNTAVGVGLFSNLANIVGSLVKGSAKELGLPNFSLYAGLVVNAVTAYACLSGSAYATLAMEAFAVFYLVAGLFSYIAPEAAAALWGVDTKSDSKLSFILKIEGMVMTCHAVLVGLLALGVDPKRSVGFGVMPALVHLVLITLITKDSERMGLSTGSQYLWILMDALVIYALTFCPVEQAVPVTP